jgi:hypothetical protein
LLCFVSLKFCTNLYRMVYEDIISNWWEFLFNTILVVQRNLYSRRNCVDSTNQYVHSICKRITHVMKLKAVGILILITLQSFFFYCIFTHSNSLLFSIGSFQKERIKPKVLQKSMDTCGAAWRERIIDAAGFRR